MLAIRVCTQGSNFTASGPEAGTPHLSQQGGLSRTLHPCQPSVRTTTLALPAAAFAGFGSPKVSVIHLGQAVVKGVLGLGKMVPAVKEAW
jgi:hypothetical protein